MNPVIILRPGELYLKKGNRRLFEQQLIRNVKFLIPSQEVISIQIVSSLFVIKCINNNTKKYWSSIIKYLIGIANASTGKLVPKNVDAIVETVLLLPKLNIHQCNSVKSFRVSVHRHHKVGFLSKQELECLIGTKVQNNTGMKVDLTRFDYDIRIELFNTFAVVCEETMKGLGGLPVSTSGKSIHLLSAGFDSPVASFLLQKRGMSVDYLHFTSGQKETAESIIKVQAQIQNLKKYQQRSTIVLFLVDVSLLFNEIVCSVHVPYRLLILKWFFIKIATNIKAKYRYNAISTGESLGQVSTQTITNLNFLYTQYKGLPLTPVIGMDKNEIMTIARQINSHEITLRPGDDLCAKFVGKHQTPRVQNIGELIQITQKQIYQKLSEKILENKINVIKI